MKKKINILSLIIVFLCINYEIKAQEKTDEVKYPETMLIRAIESQCLTNGLVYRSIEPHILIIDVDGKIEKKDLDRAHLANTENTTFESNSIKIRLELQIWHNKGFLVKSMSSSTLHECVTITTFVLQKN